MTRLPRRLEPLEAAALLLALVLVGTYLHVAVEFLAPTAIAVIVAALPKRRTSNRKKPRTKS